MLLELNSALTVLTEQSMLGLVLMFWYMLILELPRYGLSMLSLLLSPSGWRSDRDRGHIPEVDAARFAPRVSIVVAGLNEGGEIEACVRSLRAQSLGDLEIVIVSDGSTDQMPIVARDLVRKGLADKAFSTDLRCGKSSAVNLACRFTTGDIIINVDCDCSYDRFAMQRIIQPFADPAVGGVCGDIVPRNGNAGLVAAFQVIEYLASISLGKRIGSMFNQVICASGAFSGFRRSAMAGLGGLDPGGGEDLDLTMRLRANGWKVCFVAEAVCFTDVPTTMFALVRQRMRWERDAIRVRFRKHRRLFMPHSKAFKASEAVHQIDFLLFNAILSVCFPFYLIVLYLYMGSSILHLLLAAQIGLMGIDAAVLCIAIVVTKRWGNWTYLIYIPAYNLFNTLFMRSVRIWAYIQEWMLDASRHDAHYVPLRVQKARRW